MSSIEAHHRAIVDGQIQGFEAEMHRLATQIAQLEEERAGFEAQRDEAVRLREKITA